MTPTPSKIFEDSAQRKSTSRASLLRQTGRSTRMLDEAAEMAKQREYVFVIADSVRERNRLLIEFCKKFGAKPSGKNKVYPPFGGQVSFESADDPSLNFNWHSMRPMRCHPSCRVLVDHHAIEDRFHALLTELHRFDA